MRFFVTLTLILFVASAVADDNKARIVINADRMTAIEDSEIVTYKGNVVVSQGLRSLKAEEVTIHYADDEIVRIEATVPDSGELLARFEQLADDDRDRVEGEARRIVYHVLEDRLELLGSAMLSQADQTTVSGDSVDYDADARRVNASSGENSRVRTVIRPSNNQDQ